MHLLVRKNIYASTMESGPEALISEIVKQTAFISRVGGETIRNATERIVHHFFSETRYQL